MDATGELPHRSRDPEISMVSAVTRHEIEAYLGLTPAEMETIAEAAADHMWAFVRDLYEKFEA